MNTHYSRFCTLFSLIVALCFTFTSAAPIRLFQTTHSYTPGSANDYLTSPQTNTEQQTHATKPPSTEMSSPKTPTHTQPCDPQGGEQWRAPNGPAQEPTHETETQTAYQPDVPSTGGTYPTGSSTPWSESTSLTSPTNVGDSAPVSDPIATTTTTTTTSGTPVDTTTTNISGEVPVSDPTPAPVPSGPGSNVQLADGTQVSSSGENTVSVAANEDAGVAGSNSEDGSALSVAGPGVALGLAGLLGLGQTGGEIDATPSM